MKTKMQDRDATWVVGVNPVLETLREGAAGIEELLAARKSTDARVRQIVEHARQLGIPVRYVSREHLSQQVGHAHHQGLGLRTQAFTYAQLEGFIEAEPAAIEPVLLLDCIQDPQNLGSMIRSACFLGGKGVVVTRDRSAAVTSAVIKVAAGATAHLPIMRVTNLARCLEQLKEAGLWIVGLDAEGEQTLYDADLTVPLALVVGNEQKGIRPLIKRNCDLLLRIPGHGPLQSLNAATACAVALAEIQRQRLRP